MTEPQPLRPSPTEAPYPTRTGVAYRPEQETLHECKPPMRCAIYSHSQELMTPPSLAGWKSCDGHHVSEASGVKYVCMQSEPAEPEGTIWRCDCGKLWTVAWFPDSYFNVFDGGPRWRKSTWRERRKVYR